MRAYHSCVIYVLSFLIADLVMCLLNLCRGEINFISCQMQHQAKAASLEG